MRAPSIALLASFALVACGQGQSHSHVSAPLDSGAIAGDKQAEPRWADDCAAAAAAPEPHFAPIRLELVPRQSEDEEGTSPIPWEVRVAGGERDVFPAVNRDGTIMVAWFGDTQSFTGHDYDSLGFYSVATGKALGFYVLSSDPDDTSPAALSRLKRDLAAANRILDKSTWRGVSSGRKPEGPCPGTPWTKLDLERDDREEWSWKRVTRFDREGLDFEYVREEKEDRFEEKVILRALTADGTIREVTLPIDLPLPGKTTWMAEQQGSCGWSEGFDGFGSRELGVFVVYGDENFGGDRCGAELSGKRTTVIRLPPVLRAPR
ncbi:hypothetical protein [Polyangium spumosum]|uniref:Uncharacterized protein n=1 Tax=Polyangium spumosum TaxID=889282 RepID=A0A6N7PW98_9BACT|nr:hypothetical protein [Polyangium spumosum]MRG93081.1 hypothetical protein [Polyangium spumosum]